jgi:glycosyltransferase involved in cell wall biosynthesis
MPCLNEAETLGTCVRKAQEFIRTSGIRAEVVVADNGSTDGSQNIARQLGARVVDVPVRGYGAALSYGTVAARGKYIIMGDSDDSYDFLNLQPFVDSLRKGNDLVMGNRFRGGIKKGAMPWKNRYIGNPVLTAIGRIFFRTPIRDFHCGLRGYSAEAYRKMELRTIGMEFASEMVLKSTLLGLKVDEVPTTLSPDGRSRPPHLRPWRDGWRHLRFMLLYSPRWLFLYPGFALAVIGLITSVALCFGRIQIGEIKLSVNTLLYSSAMVLIGFQSIWFSICSKVFAISEGLLPEDPRLTALLKVFSLEVNAIIGVFLTGLGFAGTVFALFLWGKQSFGEMNADMLLRIVVPSVICMTIGVQVILSAFFLSLLQLRVRR